MTQLVDRVRRFNRLYTRRIGLLDKTYLRSRFSLAEVRVLYEIAHRRDPTASRIGADLGLDAGYLSRILARFEKAGLIRRKASKKDARRSHLSLTIKGRRSCESLERGANEGIAAMLEPLPPPQRGRLAAAMGVIEELLGGGASSEPYTLRGHKPGDMGWVIYRHGALYAEESGWDEGFEALVAEIAAKFIQNFDPRRERCWIAEKDGLIAGSIFLVKHSDEVAKLRLLLVEPWARGAGLGKRLVDECVRFAREAGYKRIALWTQDGLHAAIHIYAKAGFRLVSEEPYNRFGGKMVSQTWELDL
jgi:DNA-binding MarR family transcriptional regulator/N-acetylglutamate synthase-like GNAT family acetyltransferase